VIGLLRTQRDTAKAEREARVSGISTYETERGGLR